MTATPHPRSENLAEKIARLVEERGWNQEDFSRIANLNRHTVRQILQRNRNRRLRNATISQCAEALGLTVDELRNCSLDRLLPRMHGKLHCDEDALKYLCEHATQAELITWLQRNPERAAQLQKDEIEELLRLQGPEGPLTHIGVDQFIERIERKRRLYERVRVIAGTEYLPLLEQLVALIYEKVTTHPPNGVS